MTIEDQLGSPSPSGGKFALNLPNGGRSSPEVDKEESRVFGLEYLPGSVKSRWALNYRLDKNKAIENSLDFKPRVFDKNKTKGLFVVETSTNAGNWLVDRHWKGKANAVYQSLELHRTN